METTIHIDSTAPAADSYLAVGTLLHGGRYRIERYLASGGFGKTYVASDLTFEKTLVIKEFYIKGTCVRHDDNAVTVSQSDNAPLFDAQRSKFRKEAKRLNGLAHPNIVKVHDLFDENSTSYYTMDLVEGESLRDLVKSRGPLPEAQVWSIFTQLLDALAYIHERHIWHLDLKPANVLVDASGHVTLIDFGASKVIDNDSDGTQATSSALAYTPGYAPLEQEGRNFKSFGPWTDFYALGATLYNIVSGQNVPTTSEVVAEGTAAFAFLPSASKKLRDLIVWLMKPSHKERPQTVEAMRAKIGTQPVKTPSTPPTPTSVKPQTPAQPKRGQKKWWWAVVAAVVIIAVGVGVWANMPREAVTVSGNYNGHDYVDLGLPSGTLWATCNVGASSPEQSGDYFAWGETKPMSTYNNWSTYFDTNDDGETFQKYNNEGGKTELDASDDAATANWGEGWRMPSEEQIDELYGKCSWTWTQKNGVDGYEVKSKTNGSSLFLPAAGCYLESESSFYGAGSHGDYWSRSLSARYSSSAYFMGFGIGDFGRYYYFRYCRKPVRPVHQN